MQKCLDYVSGWAMSNELEHINMNHSTIILFTNNNRHSESQNIHSINIDIGIATSILKLTMITKIASQNPIFSHSKKYEIATSYNDVNWTSA